jgi:methylated-DNA-protein-cysteine methyltransferase-like protein
VGAAAILKRKPARRVPEELPGRPPFATIWRVVAAIPPGDWASYGEVARRAGLARGARLVGYVLKRAPPGLELPWHRVAGAGGRIVFPKGSRAALEQARRLRREGLTVDGGRIRGAAPAVAARSLDELLWRRDGH